MTYRVFLSDRAKSDLDASREYLSQFAPETAENWYRELLQALLRLEQFPDMYPMAPEHAEFSFEIRQILVRTKSRRANRVLFSISGDNVVVLAVRRPGQALLRRSDDLK